MARIRPQAAYIIQQKKAKINTMGKQMSEATKKHARRQKEQAILDGNDSGEDLAIDGRVYI